MTLKKSLAWAIEILKMSSTPTARLDAQLLLEKVLKIDTNQFIQFEERLLDEEEWKAFKSLVERREKGEPVAYLTGHQGFYKYDFLVGPGVLIPRPETEFVVEAVLERVDKKTTPVHICEFGLGSGCIGFTLMKELVNGRLVGFDISTEALAFAQKNRAALELEGRTHLFEENVENVDPKEFLKTYGSVDFVVANPPYIDSAKDVDDSVYNFEPHTALFAKGGTSAIESWSRLAGDILVENGYFIFEMGFGQCETVLSFLRAQGLFDQLEVVKDLSGIERVVVARRGL